MTEMHSQQGKDLSQLIQQAQGEVREFKVVREAPARSSHRKAIGVLAMLVSAVAAVFLAYPWLRHVPDSSVRAALVMAAGEARTEVEAWRTAKGELPVALPSASLSLLVNYSRSGTGYRIRASSGNIRIEMDETGTVVDR